MKKKIKGLILIIVSALAYPIPGYPSTILIIVGLAWMGKEFKMITKIKDKLKRKTAAADTASPCINNASLEVEDVSE